MRENEEIKECIKELDACYDKLYKCFCKGKFCTECNLGVPYDSCVLCILQDSIEILKEKAMNYYKQIAEMLGLELEQEFVITDLDGKRKDTITYKFTEDGLFSKANNLSVKVTLILDLLLTGKYKAVPKPWKPKFGDAYWKWATNLELAQFKRWNDSSTDFACWKLGNCFRTKEEAKTKGKEIMDKIVKEYEEA